MMNTAGNGKGKDKLRGASDSELEQGPAHRGSEKTEKQQLEELIRRLEEADIPPGPRTAILDLWGSRNRWPAWERPRLDAEVERLIATYRRK